MFLFVCATSLISHGYRLAIYIMYNIFLYLNIRRVYLTCSLLNLQLNVNYQLSTCNVVGTKEYH